MNTTIRDYLWVGIVTGTDMLPLDRKGYLLLNYRELQFEHEMGSPLDINSMRGSILKAAVALPMAERQAFEEGKARVDARETFAWHLRNLLARSGGLGRLKRLAATLGPHGRPEGATYRNVLDAVRSVPLRVPAERPC